MILIMVVVIVRLTATVAALSIIVLDVGCRGVVVWVSLWVLCLCSRVSTLVGLMFSLVVWWFVWAVLLVMIHSPIVVLG